MVRELDLRLLASPTVELPNIGLGNLSHLSDTEQRTIHDLASIARRREMASKSHAMGDGSFPIPDVPHLKKAVQAYGRAKNKPKAKRHIVRRARGLGRTDLLPEAWGVRVPRSAVLADASGDGPSNGIMAAIYPPPEIAQKLAGGQDGDLTPDDLHVTLVYLGTTDDLSPEQIDAARDAIADVANQSQSGEAQVQGVGTFHAPESDNPHWYSVDAPGLSELRSRLVEALEDAGIDPRLEHDFTPHMTIRYGGEAPTEVPEGGMEPWHVPALVFKVGPDSEVYSFGHDHFPDDGDPDNDDCLLCDDPANSPIHSEAPLPDWLEQKDNPSLLDTKTSLSLITRRQAEEFVKAPGPCSLDKSPKHNWVEGHGGLPNYICQVARAIARGGKSLESAIPIAIGTMKHWAAGGNHNGRKVSAAVQARAAEAVGEWEKMKAAAHGGNASTGVVVFTEIDGPSALELEFATPITSAPPMGAPAASPTWGTPGSVGAPANASKSSTRTYTRDAQGRFAPSQSKKQKAAAKAAAAAAKKNAAAAKKAAAAKAAAARKAAAAQKAQAAAAKRAAAQQAAAQKKAASAQAAIQAQAVSYDANHAALDPAFAQMYAELQKQGWTKDKNGTLMPPAGMSAADAAKQKTALYNQAKWANGVSTKQAAAAKATAAAQAAAAKKAAAAAKAAGKSAPGVTKTGGGGTSGGSTGAPGQPGSVILYQNPNGTVSSTPGGSTSKIPGTTTSPGTGKVKSTSSGPSAKSSGGTKGTTTPATVANRAKSSGSAKTAKPSITPPGMSPGKVATNPFGAEVAEFAWNPDIHPSDKHGRPIQKGHKVKPPTGEPGTVVGNAPARGKQVVQVNQGNGAPVSVPAEQSEVVHPPESPAQLNDMELKDRHAKISDHLGSVMQKQVDAQKAAAENPSADPADDPHQPEIDRLKAKRQPYAVEIAKRSAANSSAQTGGNVTTATTASAAEDILPGEFTFYWDPQTSETFRLSEDGSIAVFAPAVDEQEEPTWQDIDTAEGSFTVEDVKRLPEIDDQDTLEAILGASVVVAAAESDAPAAPAVQQAPADVESPTGAEEGGGRRFRIPVLIPEGVPSGDRRQFAEGALEAKEPPIQLLWQKQTDDGHKGSVIVGRIDKIERLESGGLGNAEGVFDTHADALEAARQVRERFLTGVSGDVDQFESELSQNDEGDDSLLIKHGRLVAATLVAKPAFQEAKIEIVPEEGDVPIAITASAGPLLPPKSWFFKPSLDGPTMLTVTEDGRVFGHIAEWDTPHMGNPQLKPPKSKSNYRYFNRKPLRTAEGEEVKVGQLTLVGGHAKMSYDPDRAVKHYDDTRSAVADVVAGEDEFGIWVAGSMRPDVSPEQVRAFRASEPSGDWRMRDGKLELCAICQVNVAGFPVMPKALVASGEVVTLVAAGMVGHTERRRTMAETVAELQAQVAALSAEREQERRAALLAEVQSLRS